MRRFIFACLCAAAFMLPIAYLGAEEPGDGGLEGVYESGAGFDSSTNKCLDDDVEMRYGNCDTGDYWTWYDLTNTQWCLTTTDGDGAGGDVCAMSVDDGDDNVDFTGDIDVAGSIILPAAGAIKPTAAGGNMDLTIGDNSDNDPRLIFDADTADGTIQWDEANSTWKLGDTTDIYLGGGRYDASEHRWYLDYADSNTFWQTQTASWFDFNIGGSMTVDFENRGNANSSLRLGCTNYTSGGTDDKLFQLTATLNDSGAAGGSDVFRLFKGVLTETDTTGWDNVYLQELFVGANPRYRIENSGNMFSGGYEFIIGHEKALTDGSATDFVRIAVAQGSHNHGTIWYSVAVVESGDTDLQSAQGMVTFAAVNEAGTVACDVQEAFGTSAYAESDAASTLTLAWTCVEDAADTIDIALNANTSFAATTSFDLEWSVQTAEDYTVTPL